MNTPSPENNSLKPKSKHGNYIADYGTELGETRFQVTSWIPHQHRSDHFFQGALYSSIIASPDMNLVRQSVHNRRLRDHNELLSNKLDLLAHYFTRFGNWYSAKFIRKRDVVYLRGRNKQNQTHISGHLSQLLDNHALLNLAYTVSNSEDDSIRSIRKIESDSNKKLRGLLQKEYRFHKASGGLILSEGVNQLSDIDGTLFMNDGAKEDIIISESKYSPRKFDDKTGLRYIRKLRKMVKTCFNQSNSKDVLLLLLQRVNTEEGSTLHMTLEPQKRDYGRLFVNRTKILFNSDPVSEITDIIMNAPSSKTTHDLHREIHEHARIRWEEECMLKH